MPQNELQPGKGAETLQSAADRSPLLDMSITAQIQDSTRVGAHVLSEIGKVGRLHKRQVESAGFAVLKARDIPSILIETAFISNPDEEALLRSSTHQDKLAKAIMSGIRQYFRAGAV